MDALEIISDLERRAGKAGLSMAEACRRAGMAQSTPSRWKNGTFEPTLRKLRRLEAVIAEEEQRKQAQPVADVALAAAG